MESKGAAAGQYITLKEAAELTGAAYATLRRDVENGRLPAYKVGRKYFIPIEQAQAYAQQRQAVAALEGYTIRQLMEILPLSYAYIIDLIKTGRLRAAKQGRRYIVSRQALREFLEQAKL